MNKVQLISKMCKKQTMSEEIVQLDKEAASEGFGGTGYSGCSSLHMQRIYAGRYASILNLDTKGRRTSMRKKSLSVPFILLIIVLTIFSVFIFFENFFFSSTFKLLSFRCIDDIAFQSSLNAYYKYNGVSQLLYMNDYGYGWIYWFPIFVLTYPAHILFELTGIAWPLIAIPRMSSLFFGVMCSFICYKAISIYTKNEWIRLAVVLLMPLFPAGGYFAGRFGTVNQVAFFSMLSVYCVIRKDVLSRLDLRKALFSFAVAMGTKASAIVVAPLLVLLILSRYRWKFNLSNVKTWLIESMLAVIVMVACMSPAIILAPFVPVLARQSLSVLWNYLKGNQALTGELWGFVNALNIVMYRPMVIIFSCLLALLGVWGTIKIITGNNQIVYQDYVCLSIGLFIGLFYLSLTVNTGTTYIFNYSTAITFILPFGLLLLEMVPKKNFIIFVSVLCCVIQIGFMLNKIKLQSAYNIAEYYWSKVNNQEEIEKSYMMAAEVEQLNLDVVNLYVDSRSPSTFYHPFEHENVGDFLYIFDNFDDGIGRNYDINLILLSKKSPGFLEDESFEKVINSYTEEAKNTARKDRECRQMLVNQHEFCDVNWELLYEDEYNYLFAKQN